MMALLPVAYIFSLLLIFIVLPTQFLANEQYQWLYFQFHSDRHCESIIDYVHGVRVNECQRDPTFYLFWTNSSEFSTVSLGSYRVMINQTTDNDKNDDESVNSSVLLGVPPIFGGVTSEKTWTMSVERYQTNDCSGEAEIELQEGTIVDEWDTTDQCYQIADAQISLRRYGRSVVLHVAEGTKTPQIIGNQQQNTVSKPSLRNHFSKA
jgi:hypothetical protein